MHNLVELVIGVFVELVQVCFNLLRHIRRRRRGLGPGQNVFKHYVTVVCCKYSANTSWTPSHSSPESSKAMIAQSGCLCSSPRSRCCLCSSPRRSCRRSRCRLCSSPRRRCRALLMASSVAVVLLQCCTTSHILISFGRVAVCCSRVCCSVL